MAAKDFLIQREDCDEIVERIDAYLETLLNIQKNKGALKSDEFESIARELHNLKGTCAMFGLKEATNTLHNVEERWLACKQLDVLKPGYIDYFIKVGDHFRHAFEDGSLEPHSLALQECWGCLAADGFAKNCNTDPSYKSCSSGTCSKKVILVSQKKEDQLIQKIETNYDLSVFDCPNKVYQDRENVMKASLILMCDDHNKVNPYSFIKVVNIVNRKCLVYLMRGKKKAPEDYVDFEDRLVYFSIGRRTIDFVTRVNDLLRALL